MSAHVYASSIFLATFSFIVLLLIIPPVVWHYRNRNIGATALVLWIVYLNFQSFINALIWPSDDIANWYMGAGLCDIEVKMQIASQVGAPAALSCVLRALAKVMDTNSTVVAPSKARIRRVHAIDIVICVVPAVLQMVFHLVVQDQRYFVIGISGCVPPLSATWVTIVLIFIPPVLWTLIDAYFAVLIVVRLYRYRVTFSSILVSSGTNKSRFMPLYLLCVVWICAFVPILAVVLCKNVSSFEHAFGWPSIQDPKTWSTITTIPSSGSLYYDRYIWLIAGVVVFCFFGLGRDAIASYRSALAAIGLAKMLPVLRPTHNAARYDSSSDTCPSFGSKARLIFSKHRSSSCRSSSDTGITSVISDEQDGQLDTIVEDQAIQENHDIVGEKKLLWSMPAVASTFTDKFKRSASQSTDGHFVLASLASQSSTMSSTVTGGDISPTLTRQVSPDENQTVVVVRTEMRQGTESMEHAAAENSTGHA